MWTWLDLRIFGASRGMKVPYWDTKIYWLVDDHRVEGDFYFYHPGIEVQLVSFQWRHPKVGERRKLRGREYVATKSRRKFGRVRVEWCLAKLPLSDSSAALALIRALKTELDDIY